MITGSIAQRCSSVPTAQLASNGVKLKYVLGDTMVTSIITDSSASWINVTIKELWHTVAFLVNALQYLITSPA